MALELKTARRRYAESQLVEPIETQLWEQYLKPTKCHFGIFAVLWFRDPGRYDYPHDGSRPAISLLMFRLDVQALNRPRR